MPAYSQVSASAAPAPELGGPIETPVKTSIAAAAAAAAVVAAAAAAAAVLLRARSVPSVRSVSSVAVAVVAAASAAAVLDWLRGRSHRLGCHVPRVESKTELLSLRDTALRGEPPELLREQCAPRWAARQIRLSCPQCRPSPMQPADAPPRRRPSPPPLPPQYPPPPT